MPDPVRLHQRPLPADAEFFVLAEWSMPMGCWVGVMNADRSKLPELGRFRDHRAYWFGVSEVVILPVPSLDDSVIVDALNAFPPPDTVTWIRPSACN